MKLSDQMVSRLASSVREPWASRFEIVSEAGAGGMGIVYRAKDRETGREVALKVLGLGASHERFAREAEVLERLDHPAIVDYVAHGDVADGDPWLAMEWLEGVSLSARIREAPPLSLRDAVAIARQTAGALAAAHDKGVIHRDLKPSNLFLVGGDPDRVKVLDFGVARIPTERDGAELTETGQVLGTPGYMSPEQVRGAKDVDGRSDLFSLGCVLYRMLAGRPAFEGDDVLSVLAKLAMDSPPALTEIIPEAPPELVRFVERLLAKEPALRPVSAAAAARELEAIEAELKKDGSGARRVASRPPTAPSRGVDPTGPTVASPPPRGRSEEPAPASTLPSTTEWRAEVRKPGRRIYAIAAVLAALGAAVGVAMIWTMSPGALPPAAPSASAPSSSDVRPSATATPHPITTAAPEDTRAEIQSAAARACRAWSTSLARGQKSDGSFAMEPHRRSSGWDTGQQLTPLAAALPRCGGAGALPLRGGAVALGTLFHDGGWSGPGAEDAPIEAGSTAWAALALATTRGVSKEAGFTDADLTTMDATLGLAQKSLLSFQRPDGSFRFSADADVPSDYTSAMATWALLELEPFDETPKTKDARVRAAAYLRKGLADERSNLRTTIGLTEQATWVLLRLRETGDRAEGDEAILRAVAKEIVARCGLGPAPDRACARPITDAGEVVLDSGRQGKGKIATFWHPWTTLVAARLGDDPSITSDPALAGELELVARWGAREFADGISHLVAAPTYKLSEYLFVAAMLSSRK